MVQLDLPTSADASAHYETWRWLLDRGACEYDVDMLSRACLTPEQARAAVVRPRLWSNLHRFFQPDAPLSRYEMARLVGLVALSDALCRHFGDDRCALIAYWHRRSPELMGMAPVELLRDHQGIGALRAELAFA